MSKVNTLTSFLIQGNEQILHNYTTYNPLHCIEEFEFRNMTAPLRGYIHRRSKCKCSLPEIRHAFSTYL